MRQSDTFKPIIAIVRVCKGTIFNRLLTRDEPTMSAGMFARFTLNFFVELSKDILRSLESWPKKSEPREHLSGDLEI